MDYHQHGQNKADANISKHYELYQPFARATSSHYVRCIPLWNALIEVTVTASTTEMFQRAAIPDIDIIVVYLIMNCMFINLFYKFYLFIYYFNP